MKLLVILAIIFSLSLACPPGYHYQPQQGDCVPDYNPGSDCPPGQYYQPQQGGCVKMYRANTDETSENTNKLTSSCPPGYHYQPQQGECVPDYNPGSNCPPGQYYQPQQGGCVEKPYNYDEIIDDIKNKVPQLKKFLEKNLF